MTQKINLIIDGKTASCSPGQTILEAAEDIGIKIPTLCWHRDLTPTGNCNICIVEVEGMKKPVRSCTTKAEEGMKVTTMSPKLRTYRKQLLSLLLERHDVTCPTCPRNNSCELQNLSDRLNVERPASVIAEPRPIDNTSLSIRRDPDKCILCGRCVEVCANIQTVSALTLQDRGVKSTVSVAFDQGIANSACTNCGQCVVFCPTGALTTQEHINEVWAALMDPDKFVVVQEAPAVRVSLAEAFDMDVHGPTTGKMYTALRMMGFDRVFDTNFTADLTIMEEATEFLHRVTTGGVTPLITSCSPGWIKFMETFFPNILDHLSSCKSPQQMFGTVAKTYFAKKAGIDPSKIVCVSIMPCTAKKFEAARPEMNSSGYRDVDYVLTTREFIRMIKEAGIDFKNLPEGQADSLLGEYSGAGTIFGASGGVMEAALRTAYSLISDQEDFVIEVLPVRGMEGIKEATLEIPVNNDTLGLPVKKGEKISLNVAVAHGLGNARKLLEKVNKGEANYHFIEIMACPGGCVGGGGQPITTALKKRAVRANCLYLEDSKKKVRSSHKNPAIQAIYKDFFEKPGSHQAHDLLHTTYVKRSILNGKILED